MVLPIAVYWGEEAIAQDTEWRESPFKELGSRFLEGTFWLHGVMGSWSPSTLEDLGLRKNSEKAELLPHFTGRNWASGQPRESTAKLDFGSRSPEFSTIPWPQENFMLPICTGWANAQTLQLSRAAACWQKQEKTPTTLPSPLICSAPGGLGANRPPEHLLGSFLTWAFFPYHACYFSNSLLSCCGGVTTRLCLSPWREGWKKGRLW